MAYSGAAPIWDGSSLQYKVAGLHYLPDGKTLATGKYDLVIKSESARCLYGFTSAPISATISIASADGVQNVATTVVNEKNGWLRMAAYGFTFSEKTIKVKITKAKPTSITCVATADAAKTKKVKAVNPKCPKGFKPGA